jgi:uncharacterized BrkB/YihY/UPF0761 family membrane protein
MEQQSRHFRAHDRTKHRERDDRKAEFLGSAGDGHAADGRRDCIRSSGTDHYPILPAVSKLFPSNLKFVFDLVRWPLLGFLICFALAILYRFGPYREKAKWRWITLGSASATIVWLFGCIGFTLYVAHFASYDKTYGSLAAPVVLLLWFWLTALVVLTGAEIDAEMEHADRLAARPLPQGAP